MNNYHVTQEQLQDLVDKGLSLNGMVKELGMSKTNLRYWLKKFSLSTKTLALRPNNLSCAQCSSLIDQSTKSTKFCSVKCKRDYYKNNKLTYIKQRDKGLDRKTKLVKELGGSCSACGYKRNLAALHFHHVNPKDKGFNIDMRRCSNTRWDSLVEESKKCVLLCSNCHAEMHHPQCSVV